MLKGGPVPSLLIVELSGDEPPQEMEDLAGLAARLPVWVLASHSEVDKKTLEGRGFETVLFRSVGIGDLVNRVKRRLGN